MRALVISLVGAAAWLGTRAWALAPPGLAPPELALVVLVPAGPARDRPDLDGANRARVAELHGFTARKANSAVRHARLQHLQGGVVQAGTAKQEAGPGERAAGREPRLLVPAAGDRPARPGGDLGR